MPISFGHFPSEDPPTFPALEPGKMSHFRRYFMKTGLTKNQKVNEICSIGKATWGPRTGMEVNNAT